MTRQRTPVTQRQGSEEATIHSAEFVVRVEPGLFHGKPRVIEVPDHVREIPRDEMGQHEAIVEGRVPARQPAL